MPSLSIAIPTYNRSVKLIRLLRNIEVELANHQSTERVEILVSDNASTDETQEKIENFETQYFRIKYFRQDRNIGFDGNVRFLYQVARTNYIWFFSDDDIILPGAISMVVRGLQAVDPDVLLFSFIQPPGSAHRTFNLPDEFSVVSDIEKIINYVAQYPKISMYVLRKIELSKSQNDELKPFYDNGYFWLDLSYSILAANPGPRICIISQPLASCDEEFNNIRFGPDVFLRSYTIFDHPFVRSYLPNKSKEARIRSYYDAIQLMFEVKMGALKSDNQPLFEKEIKSLRIMPGPLIRRPRFFVRLLAMKLGLIDVYIGYKRFMAALCAPNK